MSKYIGRIKSWFYKETWALPLDIFRVIFGVLCITYFYSLYNDIPDFSSQNGLINHQYFLKHWWYLNINLIPQGPSDLYFKIITWCCNIFIIVCSYSAFIQDLLHFYFFLPLLLSRDGTLQSYMLMMLPCTLYFSG